MSSGVRATNKLRDLLLVRECVRGWPHKLLQKLREEYGLKITQAGASKKIQSLEEAGHIQGYIPIVSPQTFGSPYLVRVTYDDSYRDIPSHIAGIEKFLDSDSCDGYATVAMFQENGSEFCCIITTEDIERFTRRLLNVASLSKDIVTVTALANVRGIPNYSQRSLSIPAEVEE